MATSSVQGKDVKLVSGMDPWCRVWACASALAKDVLSANELVYEWGTK